MARPIKIHKPEPRDVQGTCVHVGCNNKQTSNGNGTYKALCFTHSRRPYSTSKMKGTTCAKCGFVAVHPCQLDIDHIDGNHFNDDPSNLQTLCANCHRLKTQMEEDFVSGKYKKGA